MFCLYQNRYRDRRVCGLNDLLWFQFIQFHCSILIHHVLDCSTILSDVFNLHQVRDLITCREQMVYLQVHVFCAFCSGQDRSMSCAAMPYGLQGYRSVSLLPFYRPAFSQQLSVQRLSSCCFFLCCCCLCSSLWLFSSPVLFRCCFLFFSHRSYPYQALTLFFRSRSRASLGSVSRPATISLTFCRDALQSGVGSACFSPHQMLRSPC